MRESFFRQRRRGLGSGIEGEDWESECESPFLGNRGANLAGGSRKGGLDARVLFRQRGTVGRRLAEKEVLVSVKGGEEQWDWVGKKAWTFRGDRKVDKCI